MGALTALMSSEAQGTLPRDLLMLNFGLHYRGRNLTAQLEDDLRQLRGFIQSHKVSLHIAVIRMMLLGTLLLHGLTSLRQLYSSEVSARLFTCCLSCALACS